MIFAMIASPTAEFVDTLNRITSWPPQLRIALARRVLESVESSPDPTYAATLGRLPARDRVAELLQGLATPKISEPPQTLPLDQVVGILKPDGWSPNDEECERILEAELMRKYG